MAVAIRSPALLRPLPSTNGSRDARPTAARPAAGAGFLKALVLANRMHDVGPIFDCYTPEEKEVQKTALHESSGVAGGYTVPLAYSAALMATIDEYSFIRPRAFIVPMTSRETVCPKLAVESLGNAAGTAPWFGGMKFQWGSGGNAGAPVLNESEPKFDQVSLTAWDLIGQLVLSNQFVYDMGPEGEEQLIALFGRATAWYEEYAYLQGTGTATLQPLGILNSGTINKVTRGTLGHIGIQDITAMAAGMIPFGWNNAIWACSPSTLVDIMRISGYVPNEAVTGPEGAERGPAGVLMARPLFVTDKLPPLGTYGDLIFIDPSLYVIGDRMSVLIEASEHPLFQNFQTIFRVWLRVDGRPMTDGLITLADGSSTASPFVALN